jgi:hypothetical protein
VDTAWAVKYAVWLRRVGYAAGLAVVWWTYFRFIDLFQPIPYPSVQWTATRLIMFSLFFPLLYHSLRIVRNMVAWR